MFSFSKKFQLIFIFAFLLIFTACTRPTGMPQGSDLGLKQEDEKIDLKLKYYNKNCIYLFSEDIKTLHGHYLEGLDPELGPVSEENVPSLYELEPIGDCALAISKAAELGVTKELDPLAQDFLSALQAIAPLIAETTRYYDQMDYKMDDFAQGKELHPKLMAAFEAFNKADSSFRKAIQSTQEDLDLRVLETYKKEGKELEFLIQEVWIKGGSLLKQVESQDYDALNGEAFSVMVEEYQKALQALDAYILQHPEEAEFVQDFKESSWGYMAEAKQLMYQKLENQPYDEYEDNAEEMRDEYEWVMDYYPL